MGGKGRKGRRAREECRTARLQLGHGVLSQRCYPTGIACLHGDLHPRAGPGEYVYRENPLTLYLTNDTHTEVWVDKGLVFTTL